jgi:hypothetical protein
MCFTQMRFNVRFTREHTVTAGLGDGTPTINHVRAAFTENKRYRTNQRSTCDVVNRNAVSVYQTDVVLTLY